MTIKRFLRLLVLFLLSAFCGGTLALWMFSTILPKMISIENIEQNSPKKLPIIGFIKEDSFSVLEILRANEIRNNISADKWPPFYLQSVTCFALSPNGECYIGIEDKMVSSNKVAHILEYQPPFHLIHRYSSTGKYLGQPMPLLLDCATAIVFGSPISAEKKSNEQATLFAGKMVVALKVALSQYDSATSRVRIAVCSLDGKEEFSFELPEVSKKNFPAGFAIPPRIGSLVLTENALFVADSHNREILCFDKEGKLVSRFGQAVDSETSAADSSVFPGFFVYAAPITMAISPISGILYITNPGKHRIEAFTQDGHWEPSLSWDGEADANDDFSGFVGCCNPVELAALPDGRLVTSEKKMNLVRVFLPNGIFDSFLFDNVDSGNEQQEKISRVFNFDYRYKIATLPNGHVLVLDQSTGEITNYRPPAHDLE
ncbi:MAG: hypothetical protein ACRCUY_09440 [Thermoguttaceae bacterium]